MENHDDLAGYYELVLDAVEEPDYIIKGSEQALIALKNMRKGKFWRLSIRRSIGKMVLL